MGSKKLSVLLSFVLVLGLLLGACSSAEPTVPAAAVEEAAPMEEAAAEPADKEAAPMEEAAAEPAVEEAAPMEEAAAEPAVEEAAPMEEAAAEGATEMSADAQAAVEEAAAAVAEVAATAVEGATEMSADAQAAVADAAAAVAEAAATAAEGTKDAAADTTAEAEAAVAEAADAATEKVEEVAEAVAEMFTVPAVKPEDLYKAEDDGSFDSMSWSLGPSDIPTLDPALATDTSSNQIIQLIFMGLTMQDEETAEVEFAMATDLSKSDVAEDGSVTYTYKIRTDIPWVKYNADSGEVEPVVDCDGNVRFVTAKDFEYAIKRAADPATASDYAFMVANYVVGGAEFFAGEEGATKDGVMVKAVDDETLEITWVAEFAANNTIAGIWTYNAVPSWVIDGDACTESAADLWPTIEYINSYGPYAAKEWIHDDSFTIVKNPYWPADVESVPQAQIEEVVFRILNQSASLAEFEAGNLTGVNDVPTSEIDRIKADPVLSEAYKVSDDLCTYNYFFNTTAEFVNDARVRRALSMAIDRQSLVDNVTKGDQIPSQWFSRPGLLAAPTLETHPDLGVKFDPEAAKALIEEYMKDEGITDPEEITVEIVHNESENHARIAVAVQQMWKDNLGINASIGTQEWGVYLKTVNSKEAPQVFRMGWCQDYADAASFLNDAVSSGASQNPTIDGMAGSEPAGAMMWYNDKFENLINEAQVLFDTAERTKLYAQAEEILVMTDAAMAPLYWYTRPQLSSPELNRTYSVLGGKENFYKWSFK